MLHHNMSHIIPMALHFIVNCTVEKSAGHCVTCKHYALRGECTDITYCHPIVRNNSDCTQYVIAYSVSADSTVQNNEYNKSTTSSSQGKSAFSFENLKTSRVLRTRQNLVSTYLRILSVG